MTLCLRASTKFFLVGLFGIFVSSVSAKIIDRTAVTVNNDIILESDIDKFRQKLSSKSYQELFGGIDPKILSDRNAVLQLLVEEKLINQQVKKLELTVSEQEVDGQIRAIAKRNGISQSQLAERVKQLGTSMTDYKDAIRRQLERKNLMEREIRPSMEVSEEALQSYYRQNAKDDGSSTTYKISHILIDGREKGGVKPAARAQKVYEEVSKKPENFAEFVAQYSDDASSVETEGLLGDFSTSQLSKEFRNEVPKTAVGKVTKPIKTSAGFHIVKVLSKKAGDFTTLSREQKEMLKNQLLGTELEQKMAQWLERRKNESHIKVFTHANK